MLRVIIILAAMTSFCLAQSPVVVGTSYYAYQTNGSTGNRIAIDSQGRIHIAWTKGMVPEARPRYVFYNFRDEYGQWIGETQVSSHDGSGFVTLDLLAGDRPILAYNSPENSSTSIAVSTWDSQEMPMENSWPYLWPHITRDYDGRLHMVCDADSIGYTYSDDEGETWASIIGIAQHEILSTTICSSPVSDKSAIVYTALNESGYYDVFFFETIDGYNWDWENPHNITQFGEGDTYSAWADIDAVYDYDDVLHITYQGLYVIENVIESYGDVMHWSEPTSHSVIATNDADCMPINYALCICKMSLGVDPENNYIYALWAELTLDDVSAGGYSNGELYAAMSADGGAHWASPVNLTNSPTPGCMPPDCDSEVWSSMAEIVNDSLHIMYIDDNDAGAAWNSEGGWTLNDVLYLEFPVIELFPVDVSDQNSILPSGFSLLRVYPNPFNARTTIRFSLAETANVKLQIFDIAGRLVETLADCEFDAGENSVTWDATDRPSGVYFARLAGNASSVSKRLVLLK